MQHFHFSHISAGTDGTVSVETPQIANIKSMSLQFVNDESGELLTTADCHRCANRMLANVSLPQARVRYRAVGTDTSDRAILSSTNTYTQGEGAKFRVEMDGVNPMAAETGQVLTITVTVYNLELTEARYSFTPESVTGFRQAFRPTSLVVPPRGNGSVSMVIVPLPPTAPGTHTFTATVSDGCVTHSGSKTVTYITPVSIANEVVYILFYISVLMYLYIGYNSSTSDQRVWL